MMLPIIYTIIVLFFNQEERIMKKLLFVGLLLLFAVSCAAPTCEEQTVDYRAAVDDIIERWDDATDI
jgi:hypothetical protein